MNKKEPQSLEECQDRVQHLEEENASLRASASTFGQLAERLRDSLELERRTRPDRRERPRQGRDRRTSSSPVESTPDKGR